VIFQPKNPIIKTTKYSLINGEVIKNENVTPSGIPAFNRLKKIGIDEQEQNGVTAPKSAAKKFPTPFFWISHLRMAESEIKVRRNPMAKIMTNNNNKIFNES